MGASRGTDGSVRRGRDHGVALIALPLAALLVAGCAGGSEPSTSRTSPAATATTSATSSPSRTPSDPTRPEGPWTFVAWVSKRSDTTAFPTARVLLTTITPLCGEGPCDLTLAPAGTDGGFREPEAPVAPDGSTKPTPVTLTWDGSAYRGAAPARVVSCNLGGQVSDAVEGGYSVKRTYSFRYVAPQGDEPPRMFGTTVARTTGTKVGKAKGCTDFVETETVAAAPTGSLDVVTPLGGTYDASLSSTGSDPKTLAPLGQSLWLGQMKVPSGGTSITGLSTGVAPLAAGSTGWGGDVPTTPFECRDRSGAAKSKGADATETFADLHPVALDEAGRPVFAGTWTLRVTPNAVGRKAGCSLAAYEGRVYLVPHGKG